MMAIHFIAFTFKHNNQNAVVDSNPFMVNQVLMQEHLVFFWNFLPCHSYFGNHSFAIVKMC